jgi:hypothetical protein
MSLTVAQTTALNKLKNENNYTETTWNGDPSYSSSGDPRLDLFFKGFVRGCNEDNLNNMLKVSWCKYPEDTVKLIIHSRDCRSGKGEKKVSYKGMLWLRKYKPLTYIMNLATFLEHGYFKDLLQLAGFANDFNLNPLGITENYIELEVLAEYLREDIKKMKEQGENARISLAAKWAPSEGKHFDIKYGFAEDMASLLFSHKDKPKKIYRMLLTKLRKQLNIVESLTTDGRWYEIDYAKVPAKAHRLLRKAFLKNCPEPYKEYLNNLKSGTEKINFKGTHPHELVSTYFGKTSRSFYWTREIDETIEGQWKALVNDVKEKGFLDNTIAVSDVSGSMLEQLDGLPMSVSIALGILIAQCCSGTFHNKIISFNKTPKVHKLKGDTLKDMVEITKNIDFGLNTDIDRVFELLLNTAKLTDCKDMVKNIVIISDMQFDEAIGKHKLSTFNRNKKMFEEAGYTLPKIIFWNVNGSIESIPVKSHDSGSILISGFSAELLKDLINNGFDTDPIGFLLNVIGKYEVQVDEREAKEI